MSRNIFFIRAFFVREACLLDNLEPIGVEDHTVHAGLQSHHHLHKCKIYNYFFPKTFDAVWFFYFKRQCQKLLASGFRTTMDEGRKG
jgi:hypothetical protein